MIAAAFLAALAQAPQQQVTRYGQAIDAEWFERPHDAVIFAAITEVADSCRPSLPLVCGHLTESGRHTREVKARMIELAATAAWPEQLDRLAAAVVTEAWRRAHRDGLRAMLDHFDGDSDQDAVERLREHQRRIDRIRAAAANLAPQNLKAVG